LGFTAVLGDLLTDFAREISFCNLIARVYFSAKTRVYKKMLSLWRKTERDENKINVNHGANTH